MSRVIRRLESIDEHADRLHFVRGDIGDRVSITAALKDAEARFGTVHGVMHVAGISGIAAFKTLDQVDADECDRHFRAKAYGLHHLDDALGNSALDFRILFSSNAAILGGPGLLGYAAAHRFMDAYATASLRRSGRDWLAIDWDAWTIDAGEPRGGVGHAAGGGAGHAASGAGHAARHAVTSQEGLDALRRVLARTRAGHVIVSSGDLSARIAEWIDGVKAPQRAVEAVAHARPALDVAYIGPQNDLERTVATIWQTTLGLEQVGVNDNFFELGGNSLLGAEIIKHVKQALGCDVPIVRLFEQPTVRTFAASLAAGPADPQTVSAPRAARGERRRRIMQQQRELYREHA